MSSLLTARKGPPRLGWGGMALALALLVLAAYLPVLSAGFVWDDDGQVTPPELRSWSGLARIWGEPGAAPQYYPVLRSAFWLEYHLWGDAPLGYHLLNLALHAAVAFLLYRLLRRLEIPGARLAAALFAVHPVMVQSVAWISEERNTLAALLSLGAVLLYLGFEERPRRRAYAGATLLFGLALLTAPATATLPAVLLVLGWWRRGRLDGRRDLVPLLPWFVLGAAAAFMSAWRQSTYEGPYGGASPLGGVERVLLAGRAPWFYLGKDLWPEHLMFFYPRWALDRRAPLQYLFPLATLALLFGLFRLRRRTRGPLAAALLFGGLLFPALGFINVSPFIFSFVADRFQYLAAAVAITAAAVTMVRIDPVLPPLARGLGRGVGAALILGLGSMTFLQARAYRDPELFYRTILADNPRSWIAHANLGALLGRSQRDQEAADHCRQAMALNPNYPEAFNDYGNLMARAHQWQAAERAYAGALKARPTFAAAEYGWGTALNDQNRFLEAETHLRHALRLQPDYAEAHYALANALANSGLLTEAEDEYRAALRYRPRLPEANANLGLALAEQGRWRDALPYIAAAVRERPGYAEAHAYYGFALAQSGRLEEAVTQYREALRIGTDSSGLHFQLAHTLHLLGRDEDAQEEVERARRRQADEAAAAAR